MNQFTNNNTNTTGGGFGGQQGGQTGGGDMLDKGVDFLERKTGHEQSHSTTEKISDGIRKGFAKLTGRNVPIKDKNYQ